MCSQPRPQRGSVSLPTDVALSWHDTGNVRAYLVPGDVYGSAQLSLIKTSWLIVRPISSLLSLS